MTIPKWYEVDVKKGLSAGRMNEDPSGFLKGRLVASALDSMERGMSETVLLVEDDEALGRQVVDHLKRAGFQAVWWQAGRRVKSSDLGDVSLVILDLNLPSLPGLDLLKQLREISDVPVLVLSARQDSRDKVRALQLGADDYVTKPFWPEELIERVRARLRRPAMERSNTVTAGALVMDVESRQAEFDGNRLTLTRAEFDILLALARRVRRPVSRAWLLSNVLDPDREATERTLDVHISRLRKKIGVPDVIHTVWGIGYRFGRDA